MRVLISMLTMVVVTAPVPAQESEWQREFQKALADAQAADERKEWPQAVQHYEEVLRLIPGEITTLAALAKCHMHLSQPEKALGRLAEAVENGWNQKQALETEAIFEPIRGDARYRRLIERIDEIETENIVVHVPPGLDRTKPAALIVAFHGRGENPHMFMPTWKAAADELRAVIVAPRGVKRAGGGLLNLWDGPDASARRDTSLIDLAACVKLTDEAIAKASLAARIDPDRVVLAGYSQGGAVALQVFRGSPGRFAGVWAHAALYSAADAGYWSGAFGVRGSEGAPRRVESAGNDEPRARGENEAPAQAARGKRIFLLVGEFDPLRPRSELVRDHVRVAGADVRFEITKGTGHEPPADYRRYQADGIQFILER